MNAKQILKKRINKNKKVLQKLECIYLCDMFQLQKLISNLHLRYIPPKNIPVTFTLDGLLLHLLSIDVQTFNIYSEEDRNTHKKQHVPGCKEHKCIRAAKCLRKAIRQ